MTTPCKNCLTLSICRNKDYCKLFNDCRIIKHYLCDPTMVHGRNQRRLIELETTLKRNRWAAIPGDERVKHLMRETRLTDKLMIFTKDEEGNLSL